MKMAALAEYLSNPAGASLVPAGKTQRGALCRSDDRQASHQHLAEVLAHEFARANKESFPLATRMFDEEVRTFLLLHPHGTIVQVGGARNCRCERLDNGQAHWAHLCSTKADASDACQRGERRFRTLVLDDLDDNLVGHLGRDAWREQLRDLPRPYCFVSERHLAELGPAPLNGVLSSIGRSFPGAWMILDLASERIAKAQNEVERFALLAAQPPGSDADLSHHDFGRAAILDRSRTLMDEAGQALLNLSWWQRLQTWLFPSRMKRRFREYTIHRLILQG